MLVLVELVLLFVWVKVVVVVGVLVEEGVFDGFVIGGDLMFEFGGCVYGKFYIVEEVIRCWCEMCGVIGILYFGYFVFWVFFGVLFVEVIVVVEVVVMFVVDIEDVEIVVYVVFGELFYVVGVFMVDSLGGVFIIWVDGDLFMVVGMLLLIVCCFVGEFGVWWMDLWL